MDLAKTVPCFINAHNYSDFWANLWLFGWSADALIALLPDLYKFFETKIVL